MTTIFTPAPGGLLAFLLLATLLMGLGGIYLAGFEHEDLRTHGIVIIYIAVVMLFTSLGIYMWIPATPPDSTQEVELVDAADALVQVLDAE